MSDVQVALISGLGGALIGALAAIGGVLLSGWLQSRDKRRSERIDLISRFWAATDRLWVVTEDLAFTVVDLQDVRQEGARLAAIDQRRLQEIAERREATAEARFLLAQMRLLHPVLADPAQRLFAASKKFNYRNADDDRVARATALEEFEEAAIDAI